MRHSIKFKQYTLISMYMFFFAICHQLNAKPDYQVINCDNNYISNEHSQCGFVPAVKNNGIIIQSNLLLENQVLAGGSVIIKNGKISNIICNNFNKIKVNQNYKDYNKLTCPKTVLSPGFINPHEHIAFSYVKTKEIPKKFEHRDDWRLNKDKDYQTSWPDRLLDINNLNWIELRHLLSGTTTVASSPPYGNVVKHYQNFYMKTMPFGKDTEQALGNYTNSNCLNSKYICPMPYLHDEKDNIPHLGEGKDKLANIEIKAYLSAVLNRPGQHNYAFVHSVAADQDDLKLMVDNKISLIWSLASNNRLYGKTADVVTFFKMGGNIAISTDWSASGSLQMLDEIKAVMIYNSEELKKFFSTKQIWQMATINGAKSLNIESFTGAIAEDLAADLILVPYNNKDYYTSVLEISPRDIMAIWQDGNLQAANKMLLSFNKQCTQLMSDINYLCIDKQEIDYQKLFQLNTEYLPVI